jgi:1-acyl-sn-glycerol-3-phosphate acyltransferase
MEARTVFYHLFKILCKILFGIIGRVEVSGLEQIPEKGPLIIVSNHQSLLDPLILMSAIPRRVTFLAAAYLFSIPVVGQLLKLAGAMPVKGGKGDYGSFKKSLSLLHKGGAVGLFPEGGVSLDGNIRQLMPGWAYLVLKSGAPVLPVLISGSRNVLPPGKYIPRPGKIRITVCNMLTFQKSGKIHKQDLNQLNQELLQNWVN